MKRAMLTVPMLAMLLYCVLPLLWLLFSSTKSNAGLFSSSGLWFADDFELVENIRQVFAYQDGAYGRWFANSVLYAVAGAGGATIICALGGYALAKYDFPGSKALFAVVLGAITVPTTALAVPTFLLFTRLGLVNTPWAVLIPALASPFGLYLMKVYAADAVPTSMIEAARIDGAGELRIFATIIVPLCRPALGVIGVFGFTMIWDQYLLPLIVAPESDMWTLPIALRSLRSDEEVGIGVLLAASLLALLPSIIAFLAFQRQFMRGLTSGAVKG